MTPEEHRRLFPWYKGDPPGHGTPLHRWWVRANTKLQLRLLERGFDQLDERTRGRELTEDEAEAYRKGAALRVQLVATLRAHGG